jgi:hypothetical protein
MSDSHDPWTRKAWQALLLLVVIAIGARVVYGLLVPLLPGLIAVALLGCTFLVLFGRARK